MENLTKKQQEVLDFLKEYTIKHGYPPTVREICKGLGLSSTATVHAHLNKLIEKKVIRKDDSKNRAIEFNFDLKEKEEDNESVVPLIGTVTAGSPIEAIHNPDNFISLPKNMTNGKDVFALNVSGDSMVNAGILDGDVAIIEKKDRANNGDIIVAMTNEFEVTLKRFYKEKDHIRLQPENDAMEPIILNEVYILGKAIGLFRKM